MKKVVYSITKLNKDKLTVTGIGFVVDDGLIAKTIDYNGIERKKFYDCAKHIFPIYNKPNEYKGYHTEYLELDGRTIEITYKSWYKVI